MDLKHVQHLMYVTAELTDPLTVYLQRWGGGLTVCVCVGGGFPVGPPQVQDHGSGVEQQPGPVYSAVGLCRSRGKRGCVQGLINHGCLGRDKQSRPSRDAAAPATGGGEGCGQGEGAEDPHTRGIHHNTCCLGPHLRRYAGL